MELEYRITHTYIDKFSRPFQRNQRLLEEFNREVTRSLSLFDSLNRKEFSISLDSRSFVKGIDAVKKELSSQTIPLQLSGKVPGIKETLRLPEATSTVNWSSILEKPAIPKLKGSVEWENRIDKPEAVEPELKYRKALRDSKQFFRKLNRLFRGTPSIEPELKTEKLFREANRSLDRLNRQFREAEPTITPKINESALQEQLNSLKKELSSQTIVSTVSLGLGLNRLKEQLKEEGLSLSEALYESTKYGLRKSELAYEIAKEVNKTGGYIDATDIGNNIVTALREGVRGSEKELAYFGTLMAKYQKAFDVPAEEIGKTIYELQRFHIPAAEFEKVLGKAVALRREFNITSETMKEILGDIDQNFGFIMSRLDRASRSKFIVGMEELSAALENSYIDSTKFMEMLSGALSGNVEDLQKTYYLTGLNLAQLRKLLESGNIEGIGEAFIRQSQKLYREFGNLSPVQQAVIAQNLGIDQKTFQQVLQVGKNAQEFSKTLQKAFSIKPESPDKVIRESTNAFTRYTNVIKNKVLGLGGDLGQGAVDTITSVFDFFDSPAGVAIGTLLGERFLKWIGGKLSLSLGRKLVSEFADIGSKAGKSLIGGIATEIEAGGSSLLSRGLSLLSSLLSKATIPLTVASIVLKPEEANPYNEEELIKQWEKIHGPLSPKLRFKTQPQYSLDQILKKQIQVESAGNPYAVSRAGAVGLAQFMPQTWMDVWEKRRELFERYNPELSRFKGIPDIYNPKAQLAAQKAYMEYLIDKFKDVRWALAAYNAGEGRIGKLYSRFHGDFTAAFRFLPEETRNYVAKILQGVNAKPIPKIPDTALTTAATQETNEPGGSSPNTPENSGEEVALLKEISNSLTAIQQLIAQAYKQKLLTSSGVSLPTVDPFEQWRK